MSSSYYVEFVAPTAQEEQRIRQGDRVELYAGYHGDVGLLMSGTIFRTTTPTLEEADTAYTLRVLEGPDYTKLPKLNITFSAGTYAETIVREVVKRSGMKLNIMNTNTQLH